MSNQDLPVGRRRDDQPEFVQLSAVGTAPPWDSVLDRLANLERAHADLARFVASIHEALPPNIAAATGRALALGSPIDAVAPPTHIAPPPVLGTPPPPLPAPPPPEVDPFAQSFEAPDPWAAPPTADGFFQPLPALGEPFPTASEPPRPKRGLFGRRRATKEAQARIAAGFAAAAAPLPPPGFFSTAPDMGDAGPPPPPPPPPGFDAPAAAPDFGVSGNWGAPNAGPLEGLDTTAPPPPPGFTSEPPAAGTDAPPSWSGWEAPGPPPPPAGFASDLAEPLAPPAPGPVTWGAPPDLSSPSDFMFDEPPPPPPGYGPGEAGQPGAVPPPPPGFAPPSDFGTPFAVDEPPPPPPGYGARDPGPAVTPSPPAFAAPVTPHSSEVFGQIQEVTSLVTPEAAPPDVPEDEEERFLAGTGTDSTSYAAVPPITPDFFARSAAKGRR